MAQVTFKNQLTSSASCVAIYSSKLGFEDPVIQKNTLGMHAQALGLKIESYVDSAGHDNLSVQEISQRFSKIQQPLVLIWRLDCLPLAIKNLEDLFRLLSALGQKNISFVSVVDNIDTDSSVQDFSIKIEKAWDNFKKNRKITNARATTAKVKSQGKKVQTGRKKQRDDDVIRSLRKAGLTIREIAKRINLSTTAVQRSLKTARVATEELVGPPS